MTTCVRAAFRQIFDDFVLSPKKWIFTTNALVYSLNLDVMEELIHIFAQIFVILVHFVVKKAA